MAAWTLCASALSACTSTAVDGMGQEGVEHEAMHQAIIHGSDDRHDYHAFQDARWQALTREGIAAMVHLDGLDLSGGPEVAIMAPTMGESTQLCRDERFLEQPAAAVCSGTLIAPDLVLTAGHCLRALAQCEKHAWVFNYYMQSPTSLAPITRQDVYPCAEVVAASFEVERPALPREWNCHGDYFAAFDGCDCECGAFDPDCEDPASVLINCEEDERCGASGECVLVDPEGPLLDPPDSVEPRALLDYAIVRLDRPARGRTPVALSRSRGPMEPGAPLVMVGFPTGLPAKIDDGGRVQDARAGEMDFFLASTDSFVGNSGSGVFNQEQQLVGVLTDGAYDFSFVAEEGCMRSARVDDAQGVERVLYAFHAIDDLCGGPAALPEICDPGPTAGAVGSRRSGEPFGRPAASDGSRTVSLDVPARQDVGSCAAGRPGSGAALVVGWWLLVLVLRTRVRGARPGHGRGHPEPSSSPARRPD